MSQAGDGSAAAPVVSVERREPAADDERAYLDTVFALFDTMATDPAWRHWWARAHEGDLLLRVVVGDTRNYPQVQRVEGGVVGAICRRDIDFGDDETAAVVARTNVRHLTLTLQELLDIKPPPEL